MALAAFLFFSGVNPGQAQDGSRIPSDDITADFLYSTPGAAGSALGGFVNPAVYGLLPGSELQFFWSDERARLNALREWGLFTGAPHVGFGLVHRRLPGLDSQTPNGEVGVTDYRLALSGGDKAMSFGVGYGWSKGYPEAYPHDDVLQLGLVQRPCPYASLGIAGVFALGSSSRQGLIDMAVRPLGTPLIILFGDAHMGEKDRLADASWGAGAALELLPGVELVGKYFDTEAFTLGLHLSLGVLGLSSAPHFNDDREVGYTSYGLRVGYATENLFDQYFRRESRYLSLKLKGTIAYRKYRYFDDETHTLSDLLVALEQAIDDPRIAGVALNLSGMDIPRVMAWEVREKLKEVKEAGKHVVVFIDNAGMKEYHLASVADRIVMDPQGMMVLPGYVAGRTFLRGMLDKLGLGVDEWRFFTYKSAFEVLSREQMSEADREQRQALMDDFYALAREDICTSRGISGDEFDAWINDQTLFLPDSALACGLVDTLARWGDIEDIVESLEGDSKALVGRDKLAGREFPSRPWGEQPRIAIVYGLGDCEMDRGINARRLEKIFDDLSSDRRVKAVVFRVDSPGGDGLASDVVAGALRACAEKKPVIVSQGSVAASGGYWISMYGDTIVATPGTVTGSIGVIGGWIWNKSFGDKVGMKYDHVKAGEHADFSAGIILPILGIPIPDRNLTAWERQQIEDAIKAMYRGFVAKVAMGRKMTEEQVDAVGQGRVWSGTDGVDKGLVDVIGGLDTAVSLARASANIPPEKEVKLLEMPGKGLFKLPFAGEEDSIFDIKDSREWDYLRLLLDHPGRPLPMTPPDLYPE